MKVTEGVESKVYHLSNNGRKALCGASVGKITAHIHNDKTPFNNSRRPMFCEECDRLLYEK